MACLILKLAAMMIALLFILFISIAFISRQDLIENV
jgi:hypothetical protein